MTDRDALIASALPMVRWQARKFPRLPPGISEDDLESVGGEALIEAEVGYDPACGIEFKTFARTTVRSRMQNVITTARRDANRRAPLEIQHDDGNTSPRVDARANDPADIAECREMVAGRRSRITLGNAPDPSAVADRAAELRSAMFDSVTDDDSREIMRSVVERAKAGDPKAQRLYFDLIAPPRAGKVVVRESILFREGDMD